MALGGHEISIQLEGFTRVERPPHCGQEGGSVRLREVAHEVAVRHTSAGGQLVDCEDTVRPTRGALVEVVAPRPHIGHALGPLELPPFPLKVLDHQAALLGGFRGAKRDHPRLEECFSHAGQIREDFQVSGARLARLVIQYAERTDGHCTTVGLGDGL